MVQEYYIGFSSFLQADHQTVPKRDIPKKWTQVSRVVPASLGLGITLMTLSFYLTLENPEALRAELVEQKMSMLYLKSQVNPHFLYNTLDTIRIQAQLKKSLP